MSIDENIEIAQRLLGKAKTEIDKEDYHVATLTLTTVYANVRESLQWAYQLHREKAMAETSAGEDVT